MRKILFCFLGFLIFLMGMAFAEGNLRIYVSGDTSRILDKDGRPLTPDSNNLQFFIGSIPSPKSDTGALSPSKTDLPDYKNYYFGERGALWIRTWSGTPSNAAADPRKGMYYGKSNIGLRVADNAEEAINLPTPPAPASQYMVKSFRTDYLAAEPHAPGFGPIGEALNRNGSQYSLTLTIPVAYDLGSPKIEKSKNSPGSTYFRVQIRKDNESFPADDAPADNVHVFDTDGAIYATGSNFTPGRYYFRARAYNWYGVGPWFEANPYDTLSAAAGGISAAAVDINLKKNASGMGINSLGIPFAPFKIGSKTNISTLSGLVAAINAVSGADTVTAVAYWDNAQDKILGSNVINGNFSAGTAGFNKDLALKAGQGIQVSVSKDTSFKFEQ